MRLIDADALKASLLQIAEGSKPAATERPMTDATPDAFLLMSMAELLAAWLDAAPTADMEPRVLTLEEALGEDECWIEGRSGVCGYGDALISDDGERVDFYRPHRIDTLDFYAYGIVWRCWSSRPTDELRRSVPWEN